MIKNKLGFISGVTIALCIALPANAEHIQERHSMDHDTAIQEGDHRLPSLHQPTEYRNMQDTSEDMQAESEEEERNLRLINTFLRN